MLLLNRGSSPASEDRGVGRAEPLAHLTIAFDVHTGADAEPLCQQHRHLLSVGARRLGLEHGRLDRARVVCARVVHDRQLFVRNRGLRRPGALGSSSAATPVAAVESFYRLAAARRYSEAWALADPAFRAQLGGYRSFQAGQANDRSITFNSARVASQTATSSTVSVSTTSVQSDGTHQCSGTVDLVPGAAGRWLVHQIDINCT